MKSFKNYYEILGVKRNATQDEIKQAYRLLASKFHPDRNNGSEFFTEQFKKIQEAYSILFNVSNRTQYDREYDEFFSNNGNGNQNYRGNSTGQSYKQKPSPPKIKIFTCDKLVVNDGDEITISWEVENAAQVSISCLQGVQANFGSKKLRIHKTNKERVKISIYAINAEAIIEQHFVVTINSKPTPQNVEEQVGSWFDNTIYFILGLLFDGIVLVLRISLGPLVGFMLYNIGLSVFLSGLSSLVLSYYLLFAINNDI